MSQEHRLVSEYLKYRANYIYHHSFTWLDVFNIPCLPKIFHAVCKLSQLNENSRKINYVFEFDGEVGPTCLNNESIAINALFRKYCQSKDLVPSDKPTSFKLTSRGNALWNQIKTYDEIILEFIPYAELALKILDSISTSPQMTRLMTIIQDTPPTRVYQSKMGLAVLLDWVTITNSGLYTITNSKAHKETYAKIIESILDPEIIRTLQQYKRLMEKVRTKEMLIQ